MAGIIAVYSLVIAVLISGDLDPPPKQNYSLFKFVTLGRSIPQENLTNSGHSGFLHLGAGLSVGLTGLAAGYAIGIVGDMVSYLSNKKGALTAALILARAYDPTCCNRESSSAWYWY